MTDGLKMFLAGLGMLKYYDMFKIKGFDDESDIPELTNFDLEETIMIRSQRDRSIILSHTADYKPSAEHGVYTWLCSHALSYYFIGFIQSELRDLQTIAQLSLPNEDLYDELEIILPGHRKRLERAVQLLKLKQLRCLPIETHVMNHLSDGPVETPPVINNLRSDPVETPPVINHLRSDPVETPAVINPLRSDPVETPPVINHLRSDPVETPPVINHLRSDPVETPPVINHLRSDPVETPPVINHLRSDLVKTPPVINHLRSDPVKTPPVINHVRSGPVKTPPVINHLRSGPVETPVTHGWWGKPACLPQAKFDFLCVRALLISSLDPQSKATIDFMVDSGSDVSTVQEDTLLKLKLQLIGPIYSCGIHGGNHTNLYRARLRIGDTELDIEVMGSNYDSLGSRIVRHFRHLIDGHQHIWLKGNYKDPLPAVFPIEMPTRISVPQSELKAILSAAAEEHHTVTNTDHVLDRLSTNNVSTPNSEKLSQDSRDKVVFSKPGSADQEIPLIKSPPFCFKDLEASKQLVVHPLEHNLQDNLCFPGPSLTHSSPCSLPDNNNHLLTSSHPMERKVKLRTCNTVVKYVETRRRQKRKLQSLKMKMQHSSYSKSRKLKMMAGTSSGLIEKAETTSICVDNMQGTSVNGSELGEMADDVDNIETPVIDGRTVSFKCNSLERKTENRLGTFSEVKYMSVNNSVLASPYDGAVVYCGSNVNDGEQVENMNDIVHMDDIVHIDDCQDESPLSSSNDYMISLHSRHKVTQSYDYNQPQHVLDIKVFPACTDVTQVNVANTEEL